MYLGIPEDAMFHQYHQQQQFMEVFRETLLQLMRKPPPNTV